MILHESVVQDPEAGVAFVRGGGALQPNALAHVIEQYLYIYIYMY